MRVRRRSTIQQMNCNARKLGYTPALACLVLYTQTCNGIVGKCTSVEMFETKKAFCSVAHISFYTFSLLCCMVNTTILATPPTQFLLYLFFRSFTELTNLYFSSFSHYIHFINKLCFTYA